MSRLLPGVVLALLSWAQPGAAQDARLPPFERLIDTDFEVRQLVDECTVPTMVAGLAQRYEFVAGIEYIVSAITGNPRRGVLENIGTRTEQGARKFSVATGAASAGEALDAIVRAHGAANWIVQESQPVPEGRPSRSIFFYTFDGSGIGTGISIKP